MAEARRIAHRVEASLKERFPELADMVVHVEPDIDEERHRPGEGRAPGKPAS